MKKLILVLLVSFCLNNSYSQDLGDASGFRFTLKNKFLITEKFDVQSSLETRFIDFLNYFRIFQFKPSAGYRFNKNIKGTLGYTFNNYYPVEEVAPLISYEHRLWQEIKLYSFYNKVNLDHRFRFEERFRTNVENTKIYTNRFRYRIGVYFNIVKFKNNKYLFAKVLEEFRIRFSSGISDPKFDQNNFTAFIGYQLLNNSKIYVGYLRNYYAAGSNVYWGDNIMRVVFNYDFDFTKKK